MSSEFANFANTVQKTKNVEKFLKKTYRPQSLEGKIDSYYNNRITRYFLNHKGRTIFMVVCIILLFVCALTEYPIDGSINTQNLVSKFMSVIGFISANVFLALLFTILGVETYMSREELNELKKEIKQETNNIIEKNKNNPGFIQYCKNLLLKINRKKYKQSIKGVAVDTTGGKSEIDSELNDLQVIITSLSFDELNQVYNNLKQFTD